MTISTTMNEHAPCTRHHRHVWMASCAECTAWHLATLAPPAEPVVADSPAGEPVPAEPSEAA
jgi:hypothetical protein